MVRVVAILVGREETRLRVIVHAIATSFELLDFLSAREVQTRESEDDVAVRVAFERERILALNKQREFLHAQTSALQLVEQVGRETSQACARQGSDDRHQILLNELASATEYRHSFEKSIIYYV